MGIQTPCLQKEGMKTPTEPNTVRKRKSNSLFTQFETSRKPSNFSEGEISFPQCVVSVFISRHVINELIETEKMYVNELHAVLRGYIQEMDNPDLMPFIPEALLGNQDILFSNWPDIYKFHSR